MRNALLKAHDLGALQRSVVQTWNVKPVPGSDPSWDDLLDTLARNIEFLMRHDLHRLFTTCYLLDLSEDLVSETLGKGSEKVGARRLAEIVLEREAEKLESRRRFRREGSIDVEAEGEGDPGPTP